MRVITRGRGDPTVAVVGGIHGDEPSGQRVVERLEEMDLPLTGTVKLIVANERALEANVRYTECDLNRSFPGDPNGEQYEQRLAADVYAELEDVSAVLALHTSHSLPPPFAIFSKMNPVIRRSVTGIPVDFAVDSSALRQTTLDSVHPGAISLEAGVQGSDEAVSFGVLASLAFLRAHRVLADGEPIYTSVRRIKAYEEVDKGSGVPRLYYSNFQRIPKGELFAEDDEVTHRTTKPHQMLVLASEHGYEDIFGLLAEANGVIDPPSD